MNITKLELYNFRNYKTLKLNKITNKNIIIGSNGIGKTTILESIYVGSITKSFKSNNDFVLIKNNEVSTKIKIEIKESDKKKKLEVSITDTGKKVKINGNIKRRLSDYISVYKVIVFSPDEVRIIKDSPAIRRNYLNIEISQINKYYLSKLNNYNILIKNKNEYLKKIYLNNNLDKTYLDVLDDKISQLGFEIYNYRKEYIDKINKNIDRIYKRFNSKTKLYIKYNSDFNDLDENKIKKLLLKNRNKEIIFGMTSTGIHRDDYEFIYNDKTAKDYASQGIQKLIILSMKLSEIEIIIKNYGVYPILLLDDLFSELDKENQNKILEVLNKNVQIFITCTDINQIDKKLIKQSNIIDINKLEENKNE